MRPAAETSETVTRSAYRKIGLSGNAELVAAAAPFLDERGLPRRHRRKTAPHLSL